MGETLITIANDSCSMELETAEVDREVYILQSSDDSVGKAKSQFSDEKDIPYAECNGSIIHGSGGHTHVQGRRSKYPCLCVVVHAP